MWLVFSLLAAVFFTAQSLMSRYVLREQRDAWAYSFYFSLVGMLVSLPFAIANPKVPTTPWPWIFTIVVGLLIIGNNLLFFKAANYIEASLIGAINKFRLVWVFVFNIIVLHGHFSWYKLAGTMLAIAAGLLIVHHFRRPKSTFGLVLIFIETITNAAIIIAFKGLLSYYNAGSLTFFVAFLIPTIGNIILMPHAFQRVTHLAKDQGKIVIIGCTLGAFSNLALNQGLALGDATSVIVINEAFLVATFAGEHIFLKEKQRPWIKIAAIILATAGAILIQITH